MCGLKSIFICNVCIFPLNMLNNVFMGTLTISVDDALELSIIDSICAEVTCLEYTTLFKSFISADLTSILGEKDESGSYINLRAVFETDCGR